MPEPQTSRGQRSRSRIVGAAAAVIAARGVEGATCDQILATAGASKSQLYHYFTGKEDLVRAVIALRSEETLDCQSPWLAQLDTFAGIRAWFDMMIETNEASGAPGCPIGTLAAELAGRDDDARADLAACFDAWTSPLIDGLRRMRDRGDLAPHADPEALANAVFASLQGGLLLAKTHKDPQVLRHALDASYAHLRSAAAEPTAP